MKIEEKDVDRLNQSLSQKFRSGDKWIAYDDYNGTVHSRNIASFRQISSAYKHCENNTGDDFGESEFRYFKFQPIMNVIKSLSGAGSVPKNAANVNRLEEQIKENSLTPSGHHYKEALVDVLADGMYHPLRVNQRILPWQDIESYQVIEHFYPKGMIYEIGHSRQSHGNFRSYYEAQKCFEQLMNKYTNDRDAPELKLIGKIKGQEMALSFEDFPEGGTGVLFKMTNHKYGERGEKMYLAEQKAELDKPVEIFQNKMAKYNLRTTILEFFDGCLQKVAPAAKIPFMNLDSLSTKSVEILSSMKQTVSGDEQLNHGQEKRHGQRLKPGS